MAPSTFLASLSHAASGSAGAALSTAATYPLDLVNTRLKVQRQLAADGSLDPAESYRGVADAFARIWTHEGGWRAFVAGLGPDAAKAAADSFLFFLFYSWFRARRLAAVRGRHARHYLGAFEELAIGAAAGACARAFTAPVGNVVTHRQTASLRVAADGSAAAIPSTFWDTVAEIRREKGLLGLWAGYSASLVLTLNPSITFFMQQVLEKSFAPRAAWDDTAVAARTTFLLAAVSKVIATTITYPFQIAKARAIVSAPVEKRDDNINGLEGGRGKEKEKVEDEEREEEEEEERGESYEDNMRTPRATSPNPMGRNPHTMANETIFGTVYRIGRTEGVAALYDGIGGELIKAFFNHGLTMLSKNAVHKLIVRLYFTVIAAIKRNPQARALLTRFTQNVTSGLRRGHLQAPRPAGREKRGARANPRSSDYMFVANMLDGSQRRIGDR